MRAWTMDDPALAVRPELTGGADSPAHLRIGNWLEHLITSRALPPGDKLPAEVEIANALGVSRMTLRQALASIEAKGLIDRRRGRFGGNFVAAPRIEFDHAGLPGFTEQMHRIHVEPGAHVLSADTRKPSAEVRKSLGLSSGDRVHEILRARSGNGEPILVEEAYLPAAIFPGLLAADLSGSLYAAMREHGAAPFSADERIEATQANEQQSLILGIEPGSALLLITRTSFTDKGIAVEFSRDYHRSDRARIRIKSRVEGQPTRADSSPAS